MNNSKYQLPKHGGLVKDFAPKDIIHRYERMATRVFESEYHGVQYVADVI
jgi:glucosamine-6-phosphate deaminase